MHSILESRPMSEPKIVRLVRCPKCENLLPEPVDYSVYQCGGCGAVLRAREKEQKAEFVAEKPDEEELEVFAKLDDTEGMQEMVESFTENGVVGCDVSNLNTEPNCIAFASRENDGAKMDKYLLFQNVQINETAVNTDPDLSAGIGELGNVEELLDYFGNVSRSQGSEHISHWRDETSRHCEYGRGDDECGRALKSNYQEESPSNYFSDSSFGNNSEAGKDTNGLNRPNNINSLQKDRAELLQIVGELRDQLRRSGNLGVHMKEKSHIDQNAAHQGPNRSTTSGMFNYNVASSNTGKHQGIIPEKPTDFPYYHPHHLPQYSHAGGKKMGESNPHLFPNARSGMAGYGKYFESQMLRSRFPALNYYEHLISLPPFYHGRSFASDPAMHAPLSDNRFLHHPVCGCFNCCKDHYRATLLDYPDDTSLYDIDNNPMIYPRYIPGPSAQRGYNPKLFGPSSSLNGSNVHTRSVDDMSRYTRGFIRRHHKKEAPGKVRHHCQPVASGAPFIICQSCSKLLQLPKMSFKLKSKRQKLCCGACDTVMDCTFINKKFAISVSGESKKIVKEVSTFLVDLTHKGISSEPVGLAKPNSVSDDSSLDFQAVSGNPHVLTRGLDWTSNITQDSQSLPHSFPASLEGVQSSEGLASPSLHGLPLQDQLGHSFNANVTSRVCKGSLNTRSDHEKVMPKGMISRQNSLDETSSVAQVEEVSFNIYSKTQVSQKLEPAMQINDPVKTKKGSTFGGVIKKSLKGLSRSNHSADNRGGNVSINGFKIPDQLVKKAEKLAGPIQPGNYWYDFRAGFWGVIGGPCLGIIPPFIEELSYPMTSDCSNGDTKVFVNRRELQQIDLDLLASRGLPIARGRSYTIEISGKVVDKDSGKELDSLGKLAPTIKKLKHGFGMKPQIQIVR